MPTKLRELHVKKMLVTLTVEVEVACYTGIDRVFDLFEQEVSASNWEEGRYDFNTEQLIVTLQERFKRGVGVSVGDFFERKYGNTMIPMEDGLNGEIRKSIVEAGNWMRDDLRWVSVSIDEHFTCKLSPLPEENHVRS